MMVIKILVTVFVLFVKHSTRAEQRHQSKRLLMNDPDHVETLLHQMQVEIQNLKARLETHEKQDPTPGFAAGGYFDEEGSAAEYICLPSDPNLGATLSDNNYGSIYGAEYETNSFHSGGGLWNNDVPCAVCRSTTASHMLMIAAKNQCYDGWFTEYVGELMGGNHQQKAASSFVCVDKNPEKILGGEANRDGKLFYTIKTFCGSLKCPPYQNNRLLPCVVCSR